MAKKVNTTLEWEIVPPKQWLKDLNERSVVLRTYSKSLNTITEFPQIEIEKELAEYLPTIKFIARGVKYATVWLLFDTPEVAHKFVSQPLEGQKILFLPTYCGKKLTRAWVCGLPPGVEPEWIEDTIHRGLGGSGAKLLNVKILPAADWVRSKAVLTLWTQSAKNLVFPDFLRMAGSRYPVILEGRPPKFHLCLEPGHIKKNCPQNIGRVLEQLIEVAPPAPPLGEVEAVDEVETSKKGNKRKMGNNGCPPNDPKAAGGEEDLPVKVEVPHPPVAKGRKRKI
ncbi:uncharacterized protein LOC115225585 [Octopus sinensis]|uniref:Uncharacterized protein LOC115225585 n=1 Tax=Octopus sinensis TaxID=2607531 RepID=A0A6P7TKF8_9MOLL|nr:uncharacterized protein LOC115225585 [Octopus sinensis]XP_029652368.1 uncharacterized protein LOC115225585 [Octopus sinensis]XP_029652369.1 uncharacterized protein LOC115225585 [Octopus sinensis]